MEYRSFGNTGLNVSAVGFGAGHIGLPGMDDHHAIQLLNGILDSGINLIDTARSYGASEQRIGKYLAHRRHEFILSTKVGYSFQDKPDWSFEATMGTIDEALMLMKTDYLDVVHLHSCDKWVLEQGDAVDALEKARDQGKIRVIAYSGENDALEYAIASNRFGSIQCSVNIFDQRSINHYLPQASKKSMGIIAKRPLANAVWRYSTRPDGHGHAAYWDRLHQMSIVQEDPDWNDLALRFTAYTPGIDTMIVGTSSLEHLKENIKFFEKGPLTEAVFSQIHAAFTNHDQNWVGLV